MTPEQNRQHFAKLSRLATVEDDAAFWLAYEDYLRECKVLSPIRQAIYKMVRRINGSASRRSGPTK